ncbi:MAG: hypothetical protein KatS3mg038_0401 [Candidatus Kapaibacterium sp.]|nr:MAG: hypothetical protein KatS3mg038_0401 [Candidatus Kapabacteria bacterium]
MANEIRITLSMAVNNGALRETISEQLALDQASAQGPTPGFVSGRHDGGTDFLRRRDDAWLCVSEKPRCCELCPDWRSSKCGVLSALAAECGRSCNCAVGFRGCRVRKSKRGPSTNGDKDVCTMRRFCVHCQRIVDHAHVCEARPKRKAPPRPSSAERGYGGSWRRAREKYLQANPLCVACLAAGKYTPATIVDHIIPHRGDARLFWDVNNWQSLCASCHSRKTRQGL